MLDNNCMQLTFALLLCQQQNERQVMSGNLKMQLQLGITQTPSPNANNTRTDRAQHWQPLGIFIEGWLMWKRLELQWSCISHSSLLGSGADPVSTGWLRSFVSAAERDFTTAVHHSIALTSMVRIFPSQWQLHSVHRLGLPRWKKTDLLLEQLNYLNPFGDCTCSKQSLKPE